MDLCFFAFVVMRTRRGKDICIYNNASVARGRKTKKEHRFVGRRCFLFLSREANQSTRSIKHDE